MKPFDPRLLRAAPAVRGSVAGLAAIGAVGGLLSVASVFALSAVVVAVVTGSGLTVGVLWLTGLFASRALVVALGERVAARTGLRVSSALRSALLARWSELDAGSRPDRAAAVTLATSGVSAVDL